MGGKVPAEDMTRERVEQIAEVEKMIKEKTIGKPLGRRLLRFLEECPRMSCAYCEHIARSEAQRQLEVGGAEAG